MKHIRIIETEVKNCGDCPEATWRGHFDENDEGYKEWRCKKLNKVIHRIDTKEFDDREDFIFAYATPLSGYFNLGYIKDKVLKNCPLKKKQKKKRKQ